MTHYTTSVFTRFESLDFYLWEHLKTLVQAAPADIGKALHHSTVDACQIICNLPWHLWMGVAVLHESSDKLDHMEGILSIDYKWTLSL